MYARSSCLVGWSGGENDMCGACVFFDDCAKDVRGGGERENQEYRAVLLGEGGVRGGVGCGPVLCVSPGTEYGVACVIYMLFSPDTL